MREAPHSVSDFRELHAKSLAVHILCRKEMKSVRNCNNGAIKTHLMMSSLYYQCDQLTIFTASLMLYSWSHGLTGFNDCTSLWLFWSAFRFFGIIKE